MIQQEDWRLRGQAKYLHGAMLVRQPWKSSDPANDHDHCEFCWEKFADYDGCLHEGYSTQDRYRWICPSCFADFKERFQWRVKT